MTLKYSLENKYDEEIEVLRDHSSSPEERTTKGNKKDSKPYKASAPNAMGSPPHTRSRARTAPEAGVVGQPIANEPPSPPAGTPDHGSPMSVAAGLSGPLSPMTPDSTSGAISPGIAMGPLSIPPLVPSTPPPRSRADTPMEIDSSPWPSSASQGLDSSPLGNRGKDQGASHRNLGE